jgi:hypothetical protein
MRCPAGSAWQCAHDCAWHRDLARDGAKPRRARPRRLCHWPTRPALRLAAAAVTIFGGRGRGCRRGSQWQWQAEGLAVSANFGRRHSATLASRVWLCACLAREHRATPTSDHIAICRQATCHRFSRTNCAPAVTQTRRHGAAPLRAVVYEDCPVAADSKSYRVVKSPQRSGNSFRVILWSLMNRYSTKYPVTTSE